MEDIQFVFINIVLVTLTWRSLQFLFAKIYTYLVAYSLPDIIFVTLFVSDALLHQLSFSAFVRNKPLKTIESISKEFPSPNL